MRANERFDATDELHLQLRLTKSSNAFNGPGFSALPTLRYSNPAVAPWRYDPPLYYPAKRSLTTSASPPLHHYASQSLTV